MSTKPKQQKPQNEELVNADTDISGKELDSFDDLEETEVKPEPVKAKPGKSKKPFYEEWECKITVTSAGPQHEKLKKLRENIPMRDDQAEVLNRSVLDGGNLYVKMYFRS